MGTQFAFLLPAYKPAFFSEAIKSILSQTLSDFELIILDDCSPYNLYTIVQEFKDNRIKYYRNNENVGQKSLVACWNKLLTLTNADYIILASDDDIYKPFFLEEVNKLLIKYPNVDLVRGKVANINENGDIINIESYPDYEILDFNKFIEFMYLTNNIKCIPNYVFKRKSLLDNNGFIEFPLAWYSDTATTMKLSYHSVCMTKETVFLFRLSGINISSAHINPQTAYKKCIATIIYNDWFKKNILNTYTGNKRKFIQKTHNTEIKQMINYHILYCKKSNIRKLLFLMIGNYININTTLLKIMISLAIKFKTRYLDNSKSRLN